MKKFNTMIAEALGHYVYALADPRQDQPLRERIFYVGKGQGSRAFNHAKVERDLGEDVLEETEHKLGMIRAIRECGFEVDVLVVDHGLSEDVAFALESVLIPLIGDGNKVGGHGDRSLWLTTTQVTQRYDRPIERCDVPELHGNVLFVSLNQQDTDALLRDDPAMAVSTLGDWNVGLKSSNLVDVVVGVKYGLIVSIFETVKNENGFAQFQRIAPTKTRGHGRSRFMATRNTDLEKKLSGRSVHEGHKNLSKIRPGAGCQFFFAISKENEGLAVQG